MLQSVSDSNIDHAWLAGIYEGEGCLTHRGDKWAIIVKMTDLDVLERVQKIVGYGRINMSAAPKQEHHKQQFAFQMAARAEVAYFLGLVYPHLLARRKAKADEFFEWYAQAGPGHGLDVEGSRGKGSGTRCYLGHEKIFREGRKPYCRECNYEHIKKFRARQAAFGIKRTQ